MRLMTLRPRAILSLVAASALLLAACQNAGSGSTAPGGSTAAGGAIDLAVSHTTAGDALSGAGGMTLYILNSDTNGTSTCTTGACTAAWPPLKGDGSQVHAGTGVSGTFGTTTWADGTKQVTHNGQPLYYFTTDTAAGDATGQGVDNFFIAPVGTTTGQASMAANPSANPSATPYKAPGY